MDKKISHGKMLGTARKMPEECEEDMSGRKMDKKISQGKMLGTARKMPGEGEE